MGKRQPYACPVRGCNKTGSLSGVKQHFHEKHWNADDAILTKIIIAKKEMTMPITIEKDAQKITSKQAAILFFSGFFFGIALLGGLTWIEIHYRILPLAHEISKPDKR